jgi:hypothetical protein
MPFSSTVTRRHAIIGAAATMVSARLLGMEVHPTLEAEGSHKKSPLKAILNVTHPTNKKFDSILNEHFPGLTSLPDFESVRPSILIVRNRTETRVKAINAIWTVHSSTGLVSQYRYSYFFRPIRLTKATQSGQVSVVGSKNISLVSPFFCWTPKRFEKQSGPTVLTSLLQKYPIRNQLVLNTGSAEVLKGKVDAVIDAKGRIAGTGRAALAERYVATRHAEHDEALVLLRDIESAPGKSLMATLVQRRNAPRTPPASRQEQIYNDARTRFAGLIQTALRRTDEGSVQAILERVKNTPQTVLTRYKIV